jgi:hypothetical protein
MPRRKLPYKEGDWFAVPLQPTGYGLGLVARMNGKGIVSGYFFGSLHVRCPTEHDTTGLSAKDAILIRQFGDPGLLSGVWPIICHSDPWYPEKWPLPVFGRIAVDKTRALRVEYSEKDINITVSETPISVDEARVLPEDGLSGSGAIEIRLSNLLSKVNVHTWGKGMYP